MWPESFSKASALIKNGGTAMFPLLALGGDLGCSGGSALVGTISAAASGNLKVGILAAIVFPLLLILGILFLKKMVTEPS